MRNDGNLFQPDVVLPAQFFATLRRHAPNKRGEYQLLLAVLEDAVHCFQKYAFAKDKHGQRLFQEAEQWFMAAKRDPASSADTDLSLAFEEVCAFLGFDAEYVRHGLQQWRAHQQARRAVVRALPLNAA